MTLPTPSDNTPNDPGSAATGASVPGYPRLVGDIGGTHARFATIADPGAPLTDFSMHACADFAGIEPLLQARLARAGKPRPAACALGIAIPVTGDLVRMTNLDWSFSISALQAAAGPPRLAVINDFEALARGLPSLQASEVRQVGGGAVDKGAARAVIGPGTGLGVAGLILDGQGIACPIVGEGGHVTIAAEDDLEDRVLRVLRERFGHVSAERVLSGPGLVNLYQALCATNGATADALAPGDVTARAIAGSDALCALAVTRFLGWLGAVAGNLALTLGARGGVFIGGGIAVQMIELIDASPFRERFESKGRFRSYLADVPTWVISDASDAALRGASAALDAAFRLLPPAG